MKIKPFIEKLLVSFVFVLTLAFAGMGVSSFTAKAATGDGSKGNPFIVSDKTAFEPAVSDTTNAVTYVKLGADISLSHSIYVEHDTVIDLNNKTLNVESYALTVENGARLKIKNGNITGAKDMLQVEASQLILDDIVMTQTGYGNCVLLSYQADGKVTITNSTFNCTYKNGDYLFAFFNGSATLSNVTLSSAASQLCSVWERVNFSLDGGAYVGYWDDDSYVSHGHTIEDETYSMDDTACWKTCSRCSLMLERKEHVFDTACDETCNTCGYERIAPHTFDSACDNECNDCGYERTAPHVFDHACDEECNDCGVVRTTEHQYSSGCDVICDVTGCGYERMVVDYHTDIEGSADGRCDKCDEIINYFVRIREPSGGAYSIYILSPQYNELYATTLTLDAEKKYMIVFYSPILQGVVGSVVYTTTATGACIILFNPVTEECDVADHMHIYKNACDAVCDICEKSRKIVHTYDNACDTDCNICGETRTVAEHVYTNNCDTICNVCNAERTVSGHVGGVATCSNKAICSECGLEYGDLLAHDFENFVWRYSGVGHWKKCANCDLEEGSAKVSAHAFGEWKDSETEGKQERACACGYTEIQDKAPLPDLPVEEPTEEKKEGLQALFGCSNHLENSLLATIGLALVGVVSIRVLKKRKENN